MQLDRRRLIVASALGLSTLAGCTERQSTDTDTTPSAEATADTPQSNASGTSTAPVTPQDGAITIEGSEWTLSPAAVSAPPRQPLEITFKNVGSVAHNFTLGEFPVKEKPAEEQAENEDFAVKTETIQSGESATTTYSPERTGTFPYWCHVSGHRDAGMEGKLIVEE